MDAGKGEFPEVIPPPSVDPTVLTTEALRREITLLREEFEKRIGGLERELDSRLKSEAALRDEKFRSVHEHFDINRRHRQETKDATERAIEAALASQKEAVSKSEFATNRQLEQLTATFDTRVESLRRSIDENKERLIAEARELRTAIAVVDNKSSAITQQRRGSDATRSMIFAVIAAVVGIVGVVVAISAFAAH